MYQARGIVKDISDFILSSVLFPPVRYLAVNSKNYGLDARVELDELITLMQDLLLV